MFEIAPTAPRRGHGCHCAKSSSSHQANVVAVALAAATLMIPMDIAMAAPPTLPAVAGVDPPSERERRFGSALAACGNYLAVTTPTDGDDALEAGIARVYQLDWRSLATDAPQEIGAFRARSAGDHFGASIALRQYLIDDQSQPRVAHSYRARLCLAVGLDRSHVELENVDGSGAKIVANIFEFAGAVDLFSTQISFDTTQQSTHLWTHDATLVSPTPQAGAEFGASIAFCDDEDLLSVADIQSVSLGRDTGIDSNQTLGSGSFRAQPRGFHAASRTAPALVVGSPRHDIVYDSSDAFGLASQTDTLFDAGRVDLFEFVPSTAANRSATWQHRAALSAPTPTMSAWFGRAVAVGQLWIAVGAPGERDDRDTPTTADDVAGAGAVHIFARTPAGATYVTTLRAPQSEQSAWFGWSLALDASTLAVGCPRARRNGAAVGCVYRYCLDDLTVGPERIDAPEPQEGAAFGLSLDQRHGVLLVGAPSMDVTRASASEPAYQGTDRLEDLGACWIFERERCARLQPSTQRDSIYFGSTCALLTEGFRTDNGRRCTYAACGHQYVEEESLASSPAVELFAPCRTPPS